MAFGNGRGEKSSAGWHEPPERKWHTRKIEISFSNKLGVEGKLFTQCYDL